MSDNKTKNAGGGEPPDQDPNQGQGGDGEEKEDPKIQRIKDLLKDIDMSALPEPPAAPSAAGPHPGISGYAHPYGGPVAVVRIQELLELFAQMLAPERAAIQDLRAELAELRGRVVYLAIETERYKLMNERLHHVEQYLEKVTRIKARLWRLVE
jgi:hypothetical protein